MKRLLNAILIVFACLHVAGCASPPPAKVTAPDPYARVISADPGVAAYIKVTDCKRTTVGDLMKVQVTVVSTTGRSFTAQSKFAWYNKSGIEIDPSGRTWKPLILTGSEPQTLQSVAPNASATDFHLKLQF